MASGEIDPENLEATILFVDFAKVSDSIHRGKIEQILLAYGLPKETVAAIMILYRNMKVKVRSPDGDTDYLDIVAGGCVCDNDIYIYIYIYIYISSLSLSLSLYIYIYICVCVCVCVYHYHSAFALSLSLSLSVYLSFSFSLILLPISHPPLSLSLSLSIDTWKCHTLSNG